MYVAENVNEQQALENQHTQRQEWQTCSCHGSENGFTCNSGPTDIHLVLTINPRLFNSIHAYRFHNYDSRGGKRKRYLVQLQLSGFTLKKPLKGSEPLSRQSLLLSCSPKHNTSLLFHALLTSLVLHLGYLLKQSTEYFS